MAGFQMPTYAVDTINRVGDQRVTCPRCHREFVVDKTWPGGGPYIARPCPFCFKASRIPGGPALIYDSHETLSVTVEQAEALAYVGKIAYSPKDGPNGIMYRPVAGLTVADVRRYLA